MRPNAPANTMGSGSGAPATVTVWMALLLLGGGSWSGAAAERGIYRGRTYVARWGDGFLDVLTPGGRRLTRWPVGAACSPADAVDAAIPASGLTSAAPRMARVGGVPTLTWRWHLPEPHPFSQQSECYRFLPDRIEVRIAVRWRRQPGRLVRLVYGGRLAPGCCDLEGLWEEQEPGGEGAAWVPAPVPGLSTRTGEIHFRRQVRLAEHTRRARLILGGVDEGDVCRWNGAEIGRTPSDAQAASWTRVRQYDFDPGEGALHRLDVTVVNTDGAGGIWRGPCVVGPVGALEPAPQKDGWTRATCAGRALHHWCPDSYVQPLRGRFTVSLTSRDRTREWVPENMTSGGRFLIPPYVVAIEGHHGWWGLGTLDLPRAEDGLRVEWRHDTLACPFLLATEARATAGSWTVGPRLAILVAGSKGAVLRAYRDALPPRADTPRQDWWSGPEYCTWGDQVYSVRPGSGNDVGTLTEDRLREWLAVLDRNRLPAPVVVLDAGWWQLPKRVVEDLHRQGRRVVLWTQPHWGPDTSQHPERAMHDVLGRPMTYDPNNWILDYTVPEVRRHIAASLRSYVAPGGWNADGIKMDFPYTAAPVWAVHSDPSWGAGEQYRARVLRFCYSTVKAVKPDALVTLPCANPLFGRVQDACRLNDDWSADPQVYRRRAAVALAMGEWVNSDDWNAYEHYLSVQAVERPVWGTFTLMSGRYRGDRNNAPVPLSPAWTARLRAILGLARQAPVRAGQQCVYDPEAGAARRQDSRGDLIAAALPLRGTSGHPQALAVRAGNRLLVTAVAAGEVVLPFPGAVARCEAVGHDGSRRPASARQTPAGVLLQVDDAAGPTSHYEITLAHRASTDGRDRVAGGGRAPGPPRGAGVR